MADSRDDAERRPQRWTGELVFPFPLKGLDRFWGYRQQPTMTSPDCLNVRAFDIFEERARGGQRPGLIRMYRRPLGTEWTDAGLLWNGDLEETEGGGPPPPPDCIEQFNDTFSRDEDPLGTYWTQGEGAVKWVAVADGSEAIFEGTGAGPGDVTNACYFYKPICETDQQIAAIIDHVPVYDREVLLELYVRRWTVGDDSHAYFAQWRGLWPLENNRLEIRKIVNGDHTTLLTYTAADVPHEPATMSFKVVGSLLTFTVNAKTVSVVDDSFVASTLGPAFQAHLVDWPSVSQVKLGSVEVKQL